MPAKFRKRYTLAELQDMPTLAQGHFDNLKINCEKFRLWFSRLTMADGQPYDHQVSVERYDPRAGAWIVVFQYEAK